MSNRDNPNEKSFWEAVRDEEADRQAEYYTCNKNELRKKHGRSVKPLFPQDYLDPEWVAENKKRKKEALDIVIAKHIKKVMEDV